MVRKLSSLENDEPSRNENIYVQYMKPVYLVAFGILQNKENAEDITQEVFLDYFNIVRTTRINNVKQYLLRMARNKALNFRRDRSREYLTDDNMVFDKAPVYEENDESTVRFLKNEIEQLPEEERQIFVMHIMAGLRFREIARIMGFSMSRAYRKYKQAVRILQNKMKGLE